MKPLSLSFLFVFMLILVSCQNQRTSVKVQTQQAIVTSPARGTNSASDSVCIAAVGDLMLGTSYPNAQSLPPDSAVNSFAAVLPELKKADITFGNLEGTFADTSAHPRFFKLHQHSKAYLFRMPTNYVNVLKSAGFNVLSLANNHSYDFGDSGLKSTTHILDSMGIHYAGLKVHPTTVFTAKGVKYGFCAFAPNSQTVSIHDLEKASAIIKELKRQCDIVIVSFHGGGEGVGFEHVPFKDESFIGENRGNVFAFAHNAIDAGADVVLGNGPHVSRAMEVYRKRLIAYSLGNFCTYRSVSVSGVCGMAPLLKIYTNKKGEFLTGRIIACRQSHDKGLLRDTANRVIDRIRDLTNTDFPQPSVTITKTGEILRFNKG
jgi:hypothetical protein